MAYSIRWEDISGPVVDIDCPRCGATSVPGQSYERVETLLLLHLIPVLKNRNTYIDCPSCRAALTCRVKLADLPTFPKEWLQEKISYEASFVVKFLVVASLLLFCFPFAGLGLSVLAFLLSLRRGGWPKKVGLVALVLSALVNGGLLVVYLLQG